MGEIPAHWVVARMWRVSEAISGATPKRDEPRHWDGPIPSPIGEQNAIASYVDRETVKIDALVAEVQEAIDRLNELRTALISAPVTGKIDVREAVP